MPDSKVHRKYHKDYAVVALPISILVSYLLFGWYGIMLAVLGYMIHRWFDQDYDQIGITTSEAEISKTIVLAPLVGWSTMYAQLIRLIPPVSVAFSNEKTKEWLNQYFPRGHRSFWSHFPPIGTLLRLLWFWLPFQWLFSLVWSDSLRVEFWSIYIGLQAADWIHSIADWNETSKLIKLRKRSSSKRLIKV